MQCFSKPILVVLIVMIFGSCGSPFITNLFPQQQHIIQCKQSAIGRKEWPPTAILDQHGTWMTIAAKCAVLDLRRLIWSTIVQLRSFEHAMVVLWNMQFWNVLDERYPEHFHWNCPVGMLYDMSGDKSEFVTIHDLVPSGDNPLP